MQLLASQEGLRSKELVSPKIYKFRTSKIWSEKKFNVARVDGKILYKTRFLINAIKSRFW